MSPDERIARIAQRQYGLITTQQLRDAGLSDRAIHHRTRIGRLRREIRLVYSLPGVPHTRERKLLAAQFAVECAVLSHRSAGWLWSMKGVRPVRPEVVVARGRNSSLAGPLVHRTRSLPPGDITSKGPFVLTKPSRTLCDLSSVLTEDALEYAVDDSITRGIVSLDDLRARVEHAGRGKSGIRVLRAIVLDRIANGTPASYLETKALRALRIAGLPRPISQFEIRRSDGSFVAQPDLAYPDIHLAIELDGDLYHAGKKQRRDDLTRQNRMAEARYAFLRFNDEDVRTGEMCRSVSSYLRDA